MQYKPIENYHMENVVLGKNFNLGAIGSFSMFSPIAQQKLIPYVVLIFNIMNFHA
jgi:hypothetical protein